MSVQTEFQKLIEAQAALVLHVKQCQEPNCIECALHQSIWNLQKQKYRDAVRSAIG